MSDICGLSTGEHLIAGHSTFACVLEKGHQGEHRRGGNCFAHGRYVGAQCPQWPHCVNVLRSNCASCGTSLRRASWKDAWYCPECNVERPGPSGALAGDGATPLVGPQTNLEQNTLIINLLNELAQRIEVLANNVVGQNHFLVELKEQIGGLPNLVQRNADALLKGQQGIERAVAKRAARGAGSTKRRGKRLR